MMWIPRACCDTSTLIQKATEGALEQSGRDKLVAHLTTCGRCRSQLLSEAIAEVALTQVAGQTWEGRPEGCPPDEVLEGFATATLSAQERSEWVTHVTACPFCQSEIAELRRFLADTAEALPELGLAVTRPAPSQLPSIAAQVRSLEPAVPRRSPVLWISATGGVLVMAAVVLALVLSPGRQQPGPGPVARPAPRVAAKPEPPQTEHPRPGVTPSLEPQQSRPAPETAEPAAVPKAKPLPGQPRRPTSRRRRGPERPPSGAPSQTPEPQEMPAPELTPGPPMLAQGPELPPSNGLVQAGDWALTLVPAAQGMQRAVNGLEGARETMSLTLNTEAMQRSLLQADEPAVAPPNPLSRAQDWQLYEEVGPGAAASTNPLPTEMEVPGIALPGLVPDQEGGAPDAGGRGDR